MKAEELKSKLVNCCFISKDMIYIDNKKAIELINQFKKEVEKRHLSWTDVKNKYITFHHIDGFTENMSIDVDFAYWLINN